MEIQVQGRQAGEQESEDSLGQDDQEPGSLEGEGPVF
jgi:hypothetical protein